MIIKLPRLTKIKPTLESTCIKLMEESGELAELVGKFRKMSGEQIVDEQYSMNNIASELLDVAQVAVTMMYVLEEQHDINIDKALDNHINKLITRGYL